MSSTGSLVQHWARQRFTITRVEDALQVLQEPELLSSFFDRLLEVLTLIEANESTIGFDTSLAWDMLERGQANVMVYGEAGAGKSLLVRTLTGDLAAKSSATTVGTTAEHIHRTPSGINFIDTPGIKIPLIAEADGGLAYVRDRMNWTSMLADLDRRLRSHSATTRPLAVVYVHRATTRVIPERITELLKRSHQLLVPTFLLLGDVCSVDDDALREVREQMRSICTDLGPNPRHQKVHYIEVNTQTKVVSGHRHPSRGLPEFISTLLTILDPIDALTFTRRTYFLQPRLPVGLSQKQRVRTARAAASAAMMHKRPRESNCPSHTDNGAEANEDEEEGIMTRRQRTA